MCARDVHGAEGVPRSFPNCDRTGEVIVGNIGSRPSLMSEVRLHMTDCSGTSGIRCSPVHASRTKGTMATCW